MKKIAKICLIVLIALCIIGGISIYIKKDSLSNKLLGTWVIESSGYNSDKYTEEDMENMISNGGIFQGLMLMRNSMLYSEGAFVTFKENNNLYIGLLSGNYKINDNEIEIDLGDGTTDSFEVNIGNERMILSGEYIIELVKKNN